MPRYFFHVHAVVQHVDREGVELDGPTTAHAEAVTMAGEVLKDLDGHFTRGTWSLRVLDEDDDVVSEVTIAVRRGKWVRPCGAHPRPRRCVRRAAETAIQPFAQSRGGYPRSVTGRARATRATAC